MKLFKDSEGREWVIAINVASIKKVKSLLEIDLYKLIDDELKPLSELLSNPITLVDVLFVLCRDQAENRKCSDEDFGRGMAGDSLGEAAEAFVQELIDFYPELRARLMVRKAIKAGKQVRDQILDRMEKRIDKIDTTVEVEKLLKSRGLSGNSLASSESTPGHEP